METKYCEGCKKAINIIPFIGEKHYKFEDGVYCEKCAKLIVDKRRKNI